MDHLLIELVFAPTIEIERFEQVQLAVIIIKSLIAIAIGGCAAGVNERAFVLSTPIPNVPTQSEIGFDHLISIGGCGAADGSQMNHCLRHGSESVHDFFRSVEFPNPRILQISPLAFAAQMVHHCHILALIAQMFDEIGAYEPCSPCYQYHCLPCV
jgi:hypothetical protein